MSMTNQTIPYFNDVLGGLEAGTLISSFLYGITTVQLYLYYCRGAKDKWYIRCLVPFIWTVESYHTWTMCYYLYYLTVTNYGNPGPLVEGSEGDWSLNTSVFWDGLIGALVQSFFAHRIYVLTGKWYITLISWIGSLLALTTTIAIMILSTSANIDEFSARYKWLLTTGLSLLLFVDILNTVSLCTYLRIERTGFASTDSMLNKLFVWTLETGLITSLAATLMLIFLLVLPNTTIWLSMSIFYAKLYSNSFMASLNAREYLRNSTTRSSTWGTAPRSGGIIQFSSRQPPHVHGLELTSTQTRTQRGVAPTGDDIPKPEAKMRILNDDIGVGII